MRISDWSSDVCSSDLVGVADRLHIFAGESIVVREAFRLLMIASDEKRKIVGDRRLCARSHPNVTEIAIFCFAEEFRLVARRLRDDVHRASGRVAAEQGPLRAA